MIGARVCITCSDLSKPAKTSRSARLTAYLKNMLIRFYVKYIDVFSFILISIENSVANTAPTYAKLTMHGETYENSCSPKPKGKLMSDIRRNIVLNNRSLQNTIEFILCSDQNLDNTKRMTNLISEVVVISYEGTAEDKITSETKKDIDLAKTIMAGGRAWDATLIFDEGDVELQYFSNETCVKSMTLRYHKSSWLVHEIGEACD